MSTLVSDAFRIQPRSEVGKSASARLRKNNMAPGVIYGDHKDNVNLQVDIRDIEKGLNHTNFYTSVYEFKVNDVTEKVMVKDVQSHPVTSLPLHIDFLRISKNTKIHVNVPVKFINHELAPGIKNGGILNVILHTLEVTCSVDNIPDHLEIDLNNLQVGDSILTKDIHLGPNVVPTHPERDTTIASIVAPIVETQNSEVQPSAGSAAK